MNVPPAKLGVYEGTKVYFRWAEYGIVMTPDQARGLGLKAIVTASRAEGMADFKSVEILDSDGALWRLERIST